MKILFEDGKMKVKCDYNYYFIKRAKQLRGKWSAPYWVFDESKEEYVRKALIEIYGEDDTPCEKVTVDIILDQYKYGRILYLDNLPIAERRYRDSDVSLAANAFVVQGSFCSWGGSRNNPAVTHEDGTIVRVENLPLTIYEKVKNLDGVVLVTSDKDKEQEEVETLETFMQNYEGFDWENGTLVLVKNNRPKICTGVWKILIEKYKNFPVKDWTHDDRIMVITM